MRVKKSIFFMIVLGLFVIGAGVFALYFTKVPEWKVDQAGFLHYPDIAKAPALLSDTKINESNIWTEEKISFPSRNAVIYGLLFRSKTPALGILLLPGGAVTKEQERRTAIIWADKGYNVLTIDQRGIGETGGYYPSFEMDYRAFSENYEPVQNLQVYDALVSAAVLRAQNSVKTKSIMYMGESMGGRVAVVAAALDKSSLGLIGISTAGFHAGSQPNAQTYRYLHSFDPDSYIGMISPRPIIMLHSKNDTTIPVQSAIATYDLAKNPKDFIVVDDKQCGHGFCPLMIEPVEEFLSTFKG